jgi:hypothetical protein
MQTFSRGSVIYFPIHVLNAHKFLHQIKDEPNLCYYFIMTDLKKKVIGLKKQKLKNASIYLILE